MVVSLTVVRRAMLAWRHGYRSSPRRHQPPGGAGEGFVEAILRRAGYFVARVGRETQMPRLMKSGTDTYLPDLLAWRQENKGVSRVLSNATAGDNLRGGN